MSKKQTKNLTYKNITKSSSYSISIKHYDVKLTFSFADGHTEYKFAPYGLDDYSSYYPKNSNPIEVYHASKTYDGWTKMYDYFFIEKETVKIIIKYYS